MSGKRVALLYNPIAGAGGARAAAESLVSGLREQGHEPLAQETIRDPQPGWMDDLLDGADALVVIGGDGALRLACGPAMRSGTPVYHWPSGNENLFAREFGMTASMPRLLAALGQSEVRQADVASVQGDDSLLMTSIGFDAAVVHDLAARRGRRISHLSYVPSILRQLRSWRPSMLTVRVDGETIVDSERGVVVVANSRQYALRLDPALRASMSDGALDVVFFPCASCATGMLWMIRSRLRRHVHSAPVVYKKGRDILVRSAPARPYQIDGDPAGPASGISELSITLRSATLPVLVPPQSRST